MSTRMRMTKRVESISTLEKNMKLSPNLKDNWRIESFIVPGMKCPGCGAIGNACEATASTISRDVLFIRCLTCGSQW